jgi:glycosyltransferase involved in cell wall biosynthesis
MHVLMTADTVGGVWTYAIELARALAPLDVHVTLATMGAPLSATQARAAVSLRNVDVVASNYALEWMTDPWRDVDAAGDWLLSIAQRVRPDIVHVNGYAHAALPFRLPVVCAAHSCCLSWFRAVRGGDAGGEWDGYRRRVRSGLLAAEEVVAPTRAILRAILDAHHVPVDGRVIPNGRNLAITRTEKTNIVLAAGRLWDEAKGISTLASAAPRLSWPVRIAGQTSAPGIARQHIGADWGVHMLGSLSPEELAAEMARASIYALPARYEPFGLSVLEAALAGCALVLGDIATLREVWGHTAVYVPPDDVDALVHAIESLVRDPLRRGGLAASARARALKLTPQRMAAAYRALYDDVTPAREVA